MAEQSSTMVDQGVDLFSTHGVKAVDSAEFDDKLSIQQMVRLLHASRIDHLKIKIGNETKDVHEAKDKLEVLHKLLQKINILTDDKGGLDVTDNAEFLALLEEAKELGVELDPAKVKYTPQERIALRENISLVTDELDLNINMQVDRIRRLQQEWDQSLMILKNTMEAIKKAIDTFIRGIKG